MASKHCYGLNSAFEETDCYSGITHVNACSPPQVNLCELEVESAAPTTYAVAFSKGIRNIRFIDRFLGVRKVLSPWQAQRKNVQISCVIVWGRKKNSHKALRYAAARGLPVKYVEDGWIRSCSADAHSRVCYSLLIDDVGVYYDSSSPSALENLLNLPDEKFDKICGLRELEYASNCRKVLVKNNITKYNFCKLPDQAEIEIDSRPLVMVIDQTCDDASVVYGGMNADSFRAMLERAIDENPEARVVVRTHPDVVKGLRTGYLQGPARSMGIEISASGDNPIPWLIKSDVVYTGTSQLGYEALICGCRVKVAGKPFYAGWGLTDDLQNINRRVCLRSLDQLFYATHVYFPSYASPVSGEKWTLGRCLDHVVLQKQYFHRNAGKFVGIGITPWKRRYISQFLRSPDGQLRFSSRDDTRIDEIPMYWSYRDSPSVDSTMPLIHEKNTTLSKVRVEDGFVRSIGLGSDFVAPSSLVFDDKGLYFDASAESALENMLNEYELSDQELNRGRAIRLAICEANISKYNVGKKQLEDTGSLCADQKTVILVVGQVDGDQSLLRGTVKVQTNDQLLRSVRENNPDTYIIYKPHPDVVSGNRKGAISATTEQECVDETEYTRDFLDCLPMCSEVHTMTSLSGFEALLRGKKVFTYGMPFYAGWGLTTDAMNNARRKVSRNIDELVFLCMHKYPHYVDLKSGEFVSIETMIGSLNDVRSMSSVIHKFQGLSKIVNIVNALVYKT